MKRPQMRMAQPVLGARNSESSTRSLMVRSSRTSPRRESMLARVAPVPVLVESLAKLGPRAPGWCILAVRVHDALHQRVANDVGAVKGREGNTRDPAQSRRGIDQPAL